MTEQSESVSPFDLSKMMGEFDPTKMMDQFTKALGQYQIPGVDMTAVLESQRKNMEALTTANKQALEGMKAVATRQSEILRETMEEASTAIKGLSAVGSPTEAASKQAEFLKQAVERALSHMRELAEMSTKSNTETFDTINKRITESMDEIRQMAQKLKK